MIHLSKTPQCDLIGWWVIIEVLEPTLLTHVSIGPTLDVLLLENNMLRGMVLWLYRLKSSCHLINWIVNEPVDKLNFSGPNGPLCQSRSGLCLTVIGCTLSLSFTAAQAIAPRTCGSVPALTWAMYEPRAMPTDSAWSWSGGRVSRVRQSKLWVWEPVEITWKWSL